MNQHGFTLVELMVAVTILVIISGTVYTAFNSSLNVYERESGRIIMHQKSRVALDQIAQDLSNLFYLEGDTDLQFQAEDISSEDAQEDTITFVTVIDPSPDPYLAQLYPESQQAQQAATDEVEQATSDLVRVIYMIGPDPEASEESFDINMEDQTQPPALLRVMSRTLDLEALMQSAQEGFSALIEEEQAALASGEEPMTRTQVVVDHVLSLDFKFFDGEEWIESWEDQEGIPGAVQAILTVQDESDPTKQLIRSTMSYFVMPASGGGGPGEGGAQQGQPAGPGGGGPPGGP